jgi:hypothetical protein
MVNENKVAWAVACINEFARHKAIPVKAAFQYLYAFGGIAFLNEHFEAEHLLSFDDTVDDLARLCEMDGGPL